MSLPNVCLAGAFLVWVGTSQAQDCIRWVQRTDVSSPGERCHHAMAYDSDRKVVVFFGGEIGETGNEEYFNDTQEYDGVQWKQMSILSDTKPSHRSFHTMAYNPISKRVMLHGGFTGGKFAHDDTWSYRFDGVQGVWEQNEAGGEEGVAGARMVYDTVHQGMLRHGGVSAPFWEGGIFDPFVSPPEAEAKWWTGQTWNQLATTGPGVWGACAAWDSYRGRLVVVGGFKGRLEQGLSAEHWEYDGATTWTNLGSPIPGRGHGAAAYDSKRHRMLIVGGVSGFGGTGNQVYSYDGKAWIRLPDFPGMGRGGSAMVYDSHRDRMVLVAGVGGLANGERHADTWEAEFISLSPPQIDPSTSVTNCEGDSRTIFLRQFANREVTYQWAKVGFQNSLTPVPGATFQNLDFPSLTYTNRGNYVLIWTDKCGNSAQSDPVEIVVHTKPIITQFDETPIFICPGEPVSFEVSAFSERPVAYQWYRNLAGIQNATNQTYTIENPTHAHTGDYEVKVSSSCGHTYSDSVHLQVGVTIKIPPAPASANICGSAGFSVSAAGVGTLRYQWRLDGAPLPDAYPFQGVNTPNLKIQNVLYSHEGLYDVLVTDDCGPVHAVSSNPAKLTVLPGPQWVLRATNGPAARTGARMAFDSSRNVSVMFGGATNNGNFGVFTQNDIWEWNGSRWLQRVTNSPLGGWYQAPDTRWFAAYTNQPVGRFNHGFAYDSYRNRFVLFGGAAISPTGFQYFLNDVWEWDGIKWHFMGTNGPRPRITFGFAYDSARRVTVMTGGFIDGPNDPNVIWEWNGTDWKKTTVTNSPATSYSQDGLMVYDSFRGQTIFGPVVGNTYIWDFWLWDGVNYTNVQQGNSFSLSKFGGIAFDSYRRRTVYFGGHGSPPYNATAFFDGKSWEFLTNSPATPKGRHSPAATFDSARKAVVMFGGQSDNWIYEGDTWELLAVDKPMILKQPESQYRTNGERATFTVEAVGPPGKPLRYFWWKDGQDLESFDPGRTNFLTINSVTAADAGRYQVQVEDDCGVTLSDVGLLTLKPGLQIFASQTTATLLWSDPNVVLEQADTPRGPWSTVPGATSPFTPSLLGATKFFRLKLL